MTCFIDQVPPISESIQSDLIGMQNSRYFEHLLHDDFAIVGLLEHEAIEVHSFEALVQFYQERF